MEISEIVNECKTLFDMVTACMRTDAEKDSFNSNAFIAGGAISSLSCSESPKDWDFYFRDRETFEMVYRRISMMDISDNSATANIGGNIVQFIKVKYGTPEEIIESFDFEHCKAYYTRDDNSLGWLEGREPLIMSGARNIVYEGGTDDIISTMSRLVKFTSRGWSIDPESFATLLKDLNAFTGEMPDEVEIHSNYNGRRKKKSRFVNAASGSFTMSTPEGITMTTMSSSETLSRGVGMRRDRSEEAEEPRGESGRPVARSFRVSAATEIEANDNQANNSAPTPAYPWTTPVRISTNDDDDEDEEII